jgi:hypothetical protein
MKIDEAVKLMEKGKTCLADCSPNYSFKIKKNTLIVFCNNEDNRWRTANMCLELLKAEWELVEEPFNLSDNIYMVKSAHFGDNDYCTVEIIKEFIKKFHSVAEGMMISLQIKMEKLIILMS